MRTMIGGGGGGDGFSGDVERELNICRSGSAPPTVEGSMAAVAGIFGGDGTGVPDFSKMGNEFLTEEELRSDPSYLSYYYSHVNLNPRLPPPLLSKENWRFTRRLHAGSSLGRIGDRRKPCQLDEGGSRSLFSIQPEVDLRKEERQVEPRKAPGSSEWLDKGSDGLIGLSAVGIGGGQKSIAHIFQDDLGHSAPVSRHPSRPASRNTFHESVEMGPGEAQVMQHKVASVDSCGESGTVQGGGEPVGSALSRSFASVMDSSMSRSNTPDPEIVVRAPSPCLPPIGVRVGSTDKKVRNNCNSYAVSSGQDIVAALSSMNLSKGGLLDDEKHARSNFSKENGDHQNFPFDHHGRENQVKECYFLNKPEPGHLHLSSVHQSVKSSSDDVGCSASVAHMCHSVLMPEHPGDINSPTFSAATSCLKESSLNSQGGPAPCQNFDCVNEAFTIYGCNGNSLDSALSSMTANQTGTGSLPHLFGNAGGVPATASPGMDARAVGAEFSAGSNLAGTNYLENLNRIGKNSAASTTALQNYFMDPLYLQYLRTAESAVHDATSFSEPSADGNSMGNSYLDVHLQNLPKAYLGTLLSAQKQYGMSCFGKMGTLNRGYYGNLALGLGMSYAGSPLACSILPNSPVGRGGPLWHGDQNVPTGMRNLGGDVIGPSYAYAVGTFDDGFASSLLEEFKTNKTRCFELSEIAGHVVEFSADQYGSRFIQQRLETATNEEKNMVFEEIMPRALSLMTDVFGNYVIQKFFELGTAAQRRELADQLTGHVLTLSLQMYGCRVIQKAIEVVDRDQQIKMVAELEGHVMRCVRDQNGNHVIQKCIECIPQDYIQFIISPFFDQVVTLSTHPYGCRVIQRVLEHCDDPKTQHIVMDEILQNVCLLAQDQYGNYVVQHVLEHGKPHERSAIIKKLGGRIVQMSQQKFASNVVEKCLAFGSPAERQILVNEILGSIDENEPLQAMMKDQYANYVVQKVLETCSDQQRELILSRIKVHLSALKKYTYGKHIVARVEKLVAAGERRIGVQSS